MRRKTSSTKDQEQFVEQIMGSVLDAIATGVYQFVCEIRDAAERDKRRKQCKRKKQIKEKRTRNIAPGVAICKHGVYRCPKCERERKAKDARKNLPKS